MRNEARNGLQQHAFYLWSLSGNPGEMRRTWCTGGTGLVPVLNNTLRQQTKGGHSVVNITTNKNNHVNVHACGS